MRKAQFLFPVLVTLLVGTSAAERSPWLHVEVGDGDDQRVNVNLPLAVARIAVRAMDDEIAKHVRMEARNIELGDSELDLAELKQMWRELRKAGDGELLRVEDGRETVTVEQRGDRVLVHVDEGGRGATIRVEVPSDVIDALFAGDGDDLDLVAALAELDSGYRGDLVVVEDGDNRVRVWID